MRVSSNPLGGVELPLDTQAIKTACALLLEYSRLCVERELNTSNLRVELPIGGVELPLDTHKQ